MKKANSYREIFKRLMVFISTSPILAILIFLLNVADLILVLFTGEDLLITMYAINGVLLSTCLCFADFNAMKDPARNARLQALKREIIDAERKEREG